MKISDSRKAPVLLAFAIASIAACSDSTGPVNLDSSSALHSLAIGLNQLGGSGTPSAAEAAATFDAIAPLLDKVNVTIGGASQNMYAFGIRQSFPAGTCEETVFADPQFPPDPGVCTPPSLGVTVILWQSSSASLPPDKLIFISGDVGTSNFDFASSTTFPALAIYVAGPDKFFISESGTLTTQVTSLDQTCSIPLPPYAKSGTCSIATFTEQGSIMMSEANLDGPNQTLAVGIPSITLDGLWLSVTEVQPVPVDPWGYARGLPNPFGMSRLVGSVLGKKFR